MAKDRRPLGGRCSVGGGAPGQPFDVGGAAYDRFMGRYSRPLATVFADFAGVGAGQRVLDVGCGPGALTAELVPRVGAESVSAVDPSPSFVEACAARHPRVDVRVGGGEQLAFADATFDRVLAQLVLHFVTDGEQVAREFRRVLRPGGVAAACVWDLDEGMELLRRFYDAARAVRSDAPDERHLRFGGRGEIAELLDAEGFEEVAEDELLVSSTYPDFDELWDSLLGGAGPVGAYCASLDDSDRAALRAELFTRLGEPSGGFSLRATAFAARGRRPVA
jgi:SAM-dependent methyltransferase